MRSRAVRRARRDDRRRARSGPRVVSIREAKARARRRRWLERLGLVVELVYIVRGAARFGRFAGPVGLIFAAALLITVAALVAALVGWVGRHLELVGYVGAVLLVLLVTREAFLWRRRVARERAEIPF